MAGVRESEGWCIRRRVWPAMRRARRWRTRGLIAPVNPSLRNPGAIHIVADFRRWLCQSRGAGSARRTWPGALKRDRRRGTGCPGWAVEAFPHVGPGGHRQQWWLAWLVSPARRSRRRTTRRLGSRDATRPAPRADIYLEHNKRRWQPETANSNPLPGALASWRYFVVVVCLVDWLNSLAARLRDFLATLSCDFISSRSRRRLARSCLTALRASPFFFKPTCSRFSVFAAWSRACCARSSESPAVVAAGFCSAPAGLPRELEGLRRADGVVPRGAREFLVPAGDLAVTGGRITSDSGSTDRCAVAIGHLCFQGAGHHRQTGA